MIEKIQNNQNLYKCKECGLHYKNKEMVEKCETWCKEHQSCNTEIIKNAEEPTVQGPTLDSGKLDSGGEIEELKKKNEEYLNNWKRAVADMANYKKDEMERIVKLIQYGKEDMIEKILPILDSVYYATKHIKDEGLDKIWQQAMEFLKKEGIEVIETMGEKFNPETMECVEEVLQGPTLEESGMVVEELQKGYMIGDKVLRPAKVMISK